MLTSKRGLVVTERIVDPVQKTAVVAASDSLEYFATWHDGEVSITGPSGRISFPSIVDVNGPPSRFALSKDGRFLAEVGGEQMRISAAQSGELLWARAEGRKLWGTPRFSVDGETLALPEQGHVGLNCVATPRRSTRSGCRTRVS